MSRPSSTARLLTRLKEQGLPPEKEETKTAQKKPKRVRKRKRRDNTENTDNRDNAGDPEKKQKTELPISQEVGNPVEQVKQSLFALLHSTSNEFTPVNFLKNVKWSPDGKCLLSNSEDHILRLFEMYVCPFGIPKHSMFLPVRPTEAPGSPANLRSALKVLEGEDVYDYAWYPYMKSDGVPD